MTLPSGVHWPNWVRYLMDNNCAAVEFPDFTRGEWNVVKGYKHAYASPEEEQASMEKAKAFTAKLKEQGAKEWTTEADK